MYTFVCISAARVAQNIDFSADPCEDFYQYACGSWMDKHVVPDDRAELNTFGVLRDEVKVIIKSEWDRGVCCYSSSVA